MGELVGLHRPTSLYHGAADHTYVECGTGARGWACWGGKSGGVELRRAKGSSMRANAIAGDKDRAGITCYLINGVCHQAANRILLPAGITMDGVRGYKLSLIAFGVFGRPYGYLGMCKAPFNQHEGVAGDLPECNPERESPRKPQTETGGVLDFEDPGFIARSLALYLAAAQGNTNREAVFAYITQHFELLLDLTLGKAITEFERDKLRRAQFDFEEQRADAEDRYSQTGDLLGFAKEFDAMTKELQVRFADTLDVREYRRLLDTSPDEHIVLSDPEIVARKPEPPAAPTGATPPNARFSP